MSSDPTIDKTRIPLGAPAVGEGASWTGVMDVRGERMLVAQSPLLYTPTSSSESAPLPVGAQLGTVMVAVRMPSAWDRLQGNSSYLPTYLGIALRARRRRVVAARAADQAADARARAGGDHRTGRESRGDALRPRRGRGGARHERADHVGQQRRPAVCSTCRSMRSGCGSTTCRSVRGCGTCCGASRTSTTPATVRAEAGAPRDQVVLRRGRVLVMNRMEVSKDGRPLGSVTTLRDRTELADLEREIGSFRSTTELLRAQAHEFANQLHTISGLIQLGEYDEVVGYVDAVSEHRAQLDLTVSRRVRDTAVTALVMAKAAQADRASRRAAGLRTTPRSGASVRATRPTSRPSSATSSTTPSTRRLVRGPRQVGRADDPAGRELARGRASSTRGRASRPRS